MWRIVPKLYDPVLFWLRFCNTIVRNEEALTGSADKASKCWHFPQVQINFSSSTEFNDPGLSMSILYQIFIHPLELVMQWLLPTVYALTDNYGAALFFLSLFVNLALLPLYHLAERWQQAERRIQCRMAPKLQEFKQAFSGEERFMMVRTLYRQHRYHPIYAMRLSLGLLIQVPFFIAAYHLLSHYPGFDHASFFLFQDLANPDGLLWGINVMPFIMTGVNLLSAVIYTQDLNSNNRTQLWSISLLFLVILYAAPVALVLYWTFNNVFSIVKNLLYSHFTVIPRMARDDIEQVGQGNQKHFSAQFRAEVTSDLGSKNTAKIKWWQLILTSPYVLVLLVGVYPSLFYVSNNWYSFRVSEGLLLWGTFAVIIFLIMSFFYLALSWFSRIIQCPLPSSEGMSQKLFGLGIFLMLAYLLRFPLLQLVNYDYSIFLILVGSAALTFAWQMPKITFFRLNIVLVIISLWHLGGGLYFVSTKYENHLDATVGYASQRDMYHKIIFLKTPNVYYIVPDGYPNREALEKIYGLDNTEFYQELDSLGFTTNPRAFSNYRSTFSSMVATLGMGHHYYKGKIGNMELLGAREFIVSKQNPVVRIFKNNGYQVKYVHANNMKLFEKGCFVDLCSPGLSWDSVISILVPGSIRAKVGFGDSLRQRALKHIDEVLEQDLPHFLYIHMGKPGHSPTIKQTSEEMASFRNGYIQRIQSAEGSIRQFVQRIVKSDPNALIIISADHGSRGLGEYAWGQDSEVLNGKSEDLIALDHLGVLQAIRWPGGAKNYDQEIQTNVNLFRYIFSYLSEKDDLILTKVEDHSYLLKDDDRGKDRVLVEVGHAGKILAHWVEKGVVR